MNYGRLNADLIEELQSLLNIPVKYDEESLDRYSRDETAELKAVRPEVVTFPVSTEEVPIRYNYDKPENPANTGV